MYVGSFMHDYVRLFYIDASNYTVDELFDPSIPKEKIRERYEHFGMTYKKDEESYKNVDVPLYPTEILSEHKKQILKTLRKLTRDERDKKITLMNLLRELKEDPLDKTIKMRYGHHIKALKAKNLVVVESHGKERRYQLTHEGHILGLILSYFG